MNNYRKTIIIAIAGLAGLILLFFIYTFLNNKKYKKSIPEISNFQLLNEPTKEQILETTKRAKRNPSAENLGELAMVLHASAKYVEAGICYELAIKREKAGWIWNYYKGYLNSEMGNSELVVKNYSEVTDKDPKNGHAWYYLGQAHKNMGDNDNAEKAFLKIADYNQKPENSSTRIDHFSLGTYAKFELARLYFDNGQNESAEKMLKEIIQSQYLFGPAYRLLGTIYNLNGDEQMGKKYTTRANDLITFSPPVDTLIDKLVLISRSDRYLLKKIDEAQQSIHSDWALRLVTHGLQFMPNNKYLISKAIKMYLWKNQHEIASSFVEKHIEMFASDYIELKNTGMLFFQKNVFPQAATYWNKALELKPDDDLTRLYLARCYWSEGEKEKSLEIMDNLIDSNKENPDLLADIVSLLLEYGEREEAQELLTNLTRRSPSSPKVQKITAQLAEEDGQDVRAIELYRLSFKNNPDDLQTIRNLGNLLLEHEMWKDYIDFYREVMGFHPNNPEFMAKLGEALISSPDESLRDLKEGLEYSERAFTYFDCPPGILVSAGSHLAYAYAMNGEKQKAMNTISRTINIGRRLNISQERQAKLEGLYRGIQNMN